MTTAPLLLSWPVAGYISSAVRGGVCAGRAGSKCRAAGAASGVEASDPAALLAAVANELHSTQEATRLSALLWLNTLLSRSRKTVRCLALPWTERS